MYPNKLSKALIAAIVICATYSVAQADPPPDLPADRTIQYIIRETPLDPESDVVFIVDLALRADERDGESVGWEIEEIRFWDMDASPSEPSAWVESSPTVPTPDGLWWIHHNDHTDPQLSEFDVTPLLEGRATAQGLHDDLDYSFQGDSYDGSASYIGNVSGLTYEFTIVGVATPEEEGDDEPAELDEQNDPPL